VTPPAGRDGTDTSGEGVESDARYKWGLVAVGIGVGAIILAFLIVALLWRGPDGASALGIVASPIAAMVGAYFGIQVSAASAKTAQEEARTARKQAVDATAGRSDAIADAKLAFGTLLARDETAANKIRSNLSTIT
jgi:hypothetical protein